MYHSSSSLEYGDPCLFSYTYILGHALGMLAFTFLLCVLALCMMQVYIYLLAPFRCDCHDPCHLRLAMPNFYHESKVTSSRIFTVEIWHFAQMPYESIDEDHTLSKAKTSKSPCIQSPESQCQNHIFTVNLWKLRFYQNKWLSLDTSCGASNTFSTHNQTLEPKNQDFFAIQIGLRKMTFFLGLVIKSTRYRWPITP